MEPPWVALILLQTVKDTARVKEVELKTSHYLYSLLPSIQLQCQVSTGISTIWQFPSTSPQCYSCQLSGSAIKTINLPLSHTNTQAHSPHKGECKSMKGSLSEKVGCSSHNTNSSTMPGTRFKVYIIHKNIRAGEPCFRNVSPQR